MKLRDELFPPPTHNAEASSATATGPQPSLATLTNDLRRLNERLVERESTISKLQLSVNHAASSRTRNDALIALHERTITTFQQIIAQHADASTRHIHWSNSWWMILLAFPLSFLVVVTGFYLAQFLENQARSSHLPPTSLSAPISAKAIDHSRRTHLSPAPVPQFLRTPQPPVRSKSLRPSTTARTPAPISARPPQSRTFQQRPLTPVPPEARLEDRRTLALPPSITPMPHRLHRSAPPAANLDKERFL